MSQEQEACSSRAWRRRLVLAAFAMLGVGVVVRAAYLQVFDHEFYRGQGEARQLRTVSIPAHRGDLLDRHGEPLAVSTPIQTLWGLPEKLSEQPAALREVAAILEIDGDTLLARVRKAADRGSEFIYIKRHVNPAIIEQVMALRVSELSVLREYKRYYPSAGAASHVVGFTGIDDHGREGLEMAYDNWLAGKPGKRRVQRDRTGREITGTDIVVEAVPGKDLRLSIDRRLQYFADRALATAGTRHRAESASAIVMDVVTGEVVAMSNFPSYNPNDMGDRRGTRQRNRTLTDVFEPGSTMKPFTIGAALESGRFAVDDLVDTSPGSWGIGKYRIHDIRDYGQLDLTGIVVKSSNVGISKVAIQLDPVQMWTAFDRLGFGRPPGSEFPGEVAGFFNHPASWNGVEQASVSYGYGLSVTALQLVRAYAAIASGGVLPPVSFLAVEESTQAAERTAAESTRVIDKSIADRLAGMLESVVRDGTGHRASIPGYRVAGKTGTSHRSQSGGYAEDRYVSIFAGFAPVSQPRYAAVVVVHDPKAGEHFGSVVAAPVFADIVANALRLAAVEPDDVEALRGAVAALPGNRL